MVQPDQMEKYAVIFAEACGNEPLVAGACVLGAEAARPLLERSGLPTSDLSHIWRLSDGDMDGQLTLGEFACAMHLCSHRLAGAELPNELPEELAAMRSGTDTTDSPWAPSQEQLEGYIQLFQQAEAKTCPADHVGSGRE